MKINRVGDSFTALEKSQMGVIDKLQDKIGLLEFDKSKNNTMIRELKYILNNKKRSINEIMKEIDEIQKTKDYQRLRYIKNVLGIIARQGVDDE